MARQPFRFTRPQSNLCTCFCSLALLLSYFCTASAQNFVIFTNPVARNTTFGVKVAAAGTDRVLIGDFLDGQGGVIFLFQTNGTLLLTFSNPFPLGTIGESFATLGTNHLIAGAPTSDDGAAHLFRLDGTLVKSFSEPQPAISVNFGWVVDALAEDRVLIAAPDIWTSGPGRVYLFHTNGTLLTTITNPQPAITRNFGKAIRVRGTNDLFISAEGVAPGVISQGAVYRFDTNGVLQHTYRGIETNKDNSFGHAVEFLGKSKLAISSPGVRSVYIYEDDGRFVGRVVNPPSEINAFGATLREVNNALLIGCVAGGNVGMYELCGDPMRNFLGAGTQFGETIDVLAGKHVLIGGTGWEGGYAALFFNSTDRILTPLVESDFAAGSDGWSGAPKSADWNSTGSMFVTAMNLFSETNSWIAPPKFLGNRSAAYNGRLQFDQRSTADVIRRSGQVLLRGAGYEIVHEVEPPGPEFATRSVDLHPDGWTHTASGAPVTTAQFLTLLSDLSWIEIRAEFGENTTELTVLDNVRLSIPQTICEPILRVDDTPAGTKLDWPANAANFNLYRSTNLSVTNWTQVTTVPSEANAVRSVTDNNSPSPAFYKLSKP